MADVEVAHLALDATRVEATAAADAATPARSRRAARVAKQLMANGGTARLAASFA